MAIKQNKLPTMTELMDYLNQQTGAMTKRTIARDFGVKGDARKELKYMIKDLKKKGVLETRNERGRSIRLVGSLPDHCQIEITGQDSMGDLIARPLEWQSRDPMPQILVTKNKINPPAGIGDIVQARLRSIGSKLYEAEILRRITAGDNHMLGVYENGHVYSVDRRLKQSFVLLDVPRDVQNKDILIVDIPMIRSREPIAKFVRKIGSSTDAYAATLIAIYMHHLPIVFSEQTEKEVQHLKVPSIDENRLDLRAIPFVTIDGADARDFDDAVWAEPDLDEKNKGGYHIMVGIADVAWYVRSGSALDMDARLRGNSVYFPDRVIPMLPFELSNGVCSLKPHEPRAVLVCEIWMDKTGTKKRHRFVRALIQSDRRLTYPEVQEAIDGKTPIHGLETEIDTLKCVYELLQKKRQKRGVIEIDVPEQEVELNSKGDVIGIHAREQIQSMKLIEELMILANVSAAETLEEKGQPTMYRIHDKPSPEKLSVLNNFLKSIGMKTTHPLNEEAVPADFNSILAKAQGTSKDFAINEFVLRSQSQAVYSPENIGHFGLSLMRYAHFTSPIRRYADVMVHRALITALKLGEGGLSKEETDGFDTIARHISATERQASSAEQDALDRYIASYLKDRVGQTFLARISSVTQFGLFVRLIENGADGFVPMRSLRGDFFEYDNEAQLLIGRSTGRKFLVGDNIRVVLKECSPITGGLLFELKK